MMAWWRAGVGVATAAFTGYMLIVRPWARRWGATDLELHQSMPGDELAPNAANQTTRAIAIEAPTTAVWPWLIQMGQGRAGFYSYDWLEGILGFGTRNADRVMPEYQLLKAGQEVQFHPTLPPMRVTVLEPGRALAFSTGWAFLLTQVDARTTRLIVRSRGGKAPGWLGWLVQSLIYEPAQFLMERQMLLGIKRRVEYEEKTRRAMPPHAPNASSSSEG